jgi:hypothetical protein
MREAHETERARKSVRTQMHQHDKVVEDLDSNDKVPIRRQIIREMNAILREQQDQGGGTGLERKNRWAPGGRSREEAATLAGNSANAELAAGQRATTVPLIRLYSASRLTIIIHLGHETPPQRVYQATHSSSKPSG